MAFRFAYRLAAAACVGLAATAGVVEATPPIPAVAPGADQKLADAVAQKLGDSPQLSGYHVDISCNAGSVELTGVVRGAAQRAEVVKIVGSVMGVKNISDRLAVDVTIVPTQAVEAIPGPAGPVMLPPTGMPSAIPGSLPGGMPNAMPVGPSGQIGMDPSPIGVPPTGGLYDSTPPKMPPYAWPTYAPYNNYSRVGYPTEYPANAFPFIGPFYPFPKVPLGFRAIKLEWEDGAWYYGRTATYRDYWKVRYW